jgi:hypothetical protein
MRPPGGNSKKLSKYTEYPAPRILIDIGARTSLASAQLYCILTETGHKFLPITVQLVQADGSSTLTNVKTATLSVKQQGKEMETTFITIPDAHYYYYYHTSGNIVFTEGRPGHQLCPFQMAFFRTMPPDLRFCRERSNAKRYTNGRNADRFHCPLPINSSPTKNSPADRHRCANGNRHRPGPGSHDSNFPESARHFCRVPSSNSGVSNHHPV